MSNPPHHFRLFVCGESRQSQDAVESLNLIGEKNLKGHFKLEVIDVLRDPATAEENRVLATPTLFKIFPEPTCKLVGDLSDGTKVLDALGLRS